MKQFKKLMVFMLAALMVFGTIKYTPIYAEDAVAKEEGVFDTVTFEGEKNITIHAGKAFTFTQKIKKETEINTGEEEIIPETEEASQEKKKPIVTVKATREGDSAKYRAIVSEVKTPEGGNFVYHEGDTTFMPAEAEVGKEYVITYQAETSIDDGKTWQEVPDAKYEVHVKIAEKEEQATESEEQLTSGESEDEDNQENLQITADDIVFHGEENRTIKIGDNYYFTDSDNIAVTSTIESNTAYKAIVSSVVTPEGGSYTYHEGDEKFTPTIDDENLEYVITYHAIKSVDNGETWEEVPNQLFTTHLKVAKTEARSRRRRSTPIYDGLISHLKVGLDDTYYTGQAVNTTVSVAINGTSTVDEPFIVEIVVPKDGIYGKNPTESKYRLQISEYSKSLETNMTEDATSYIMSYKLMPSAQAQVFAIPLNFKFLRTGDVPAGTQYTISARVKDLNGNVVKTVSKTTTLKYNIPNSLNLDGNHYVSMKRDSIMLNSAGTALTTDVSKLGDLYVYPNVFQPDVPVDTQNDPIGIRNISRIVDTYTFPSNAYVDPSTLPVGAVYNSTNHTVVRTFTNTRNWGEGATLRGWNFNRADEITFKLPGSNINQPYTIQLTREYQFDNDPASNFSISANNRVYFGIEDYDYQYYLESVRKQDGHFSITYMPNAKPSIFFDNRIGWQSNPYVQVSAIRTLATNDPNPVSRLTVEPAGGLTVSNNELDSNLLYNSVVINPESDTRPTTFSGTLKIVGVKSDGTEEVIADNIQYQVGASSTIPITGEYKRVKVIANDGSTFQTIKREYNSVSAPTTYAQQGITVRYTYKFIDGLDINEPYIFKGKLDLSKPTNSQDPWVFYDYARCHDDKWYWNIEYGIWHSQQTDYIYAFFYHPVSDVSNLLASSSVTSTSVSGTGNQHLSYIGDEFKYNAKIIKSRNSTNTAMYDGKMKFYLPIGYELESGTEVVTLGTNGYFEKNPTSILASRTGPFTDSNNGQQYYLYDFGNVSGQNEGGLIVDFQATIKHISYNPDIREYDPLRYASLELKFDEEQHIVVYETNTRNSGTLEEFSKLHLYPWNYVNDNNNYTVIATKQTVTNIPYARSGSGYNYSTDISRYGDAKNYLNLTSQRITAYTGADYLNDIIELSIGISSAAILNDTYTSSKLNLNLPDGLEIVPGSESLVDSNGNFHSNKSLSEIIASRDGDSYDFGETQVVANKPWALALKLKVKVTDKMISNPVYFNPVMKINSPSGVITSKETLYPDTQTNLRVFKYVPTTGLYSMLTGMGVTRKSYVQNGGNITYEINIGNYTGNDVKNVTIIDYLPRVGDVDAKGNPRNSELTPDIKYISPDNKFDLFVSKDTPRAGMTVAEYDGTATWTQIYGGANERELKDVKAFKLVYRGKMSPGIQTTAATFRGVVRPEDQIKENLGKVINDSFAVRYTIGNLDTNFVESNIKQYEYKALKVKGRVFVDYNRNGIYDEGDTLYDGYLTTGKIYKDGTEQNWEVVNYDSNFQFRTLLLPEEGRYRFSVIPPSGYKLAPYGSAENQSNFNPDTKYSEAYNLSYDGTDEIFLSIGLQPDGRYTVKYDLNGGHLKDSTDTYFYADYTPGLDMITRWIDKGRYLRPYYEADLVWNTEPDGTGTSYTGSQTITGGLSSVPNTVVKLYLQWKPITSYIVRYNPSGPTTIISGSMADDTVTVGTGYTVRNNGFTNTHAQFAGWTLADGTAFYEGQYVSDLWDGNLIDPTTGTLRTQPIVINLYANWKQDLYTFKADSANFSTWGGYTTENPDHPFDSSDPYHMDPTKSHPNNYIPTNPVVGAKFRINKINADGSEGEVVSTATSRTQGQLYFKNMSAGKYYLTEEVTPDGYIKPNGKWIIEVVIDQFTGDLTIKVDPYSPTPGDRTDPSMLALSNYPYFGKSMNGCILNEVAYYRTVSLSTRISDENVEFASINQNYRYKITFLDKQFEPIKNTSYQYEGETIAGITNAHSAPPNGTLTTDENGVAYVTLKHGQRIKMKDILGGTKVSVLQLTEGGDVYTQVDTSGFAFNPDRAVAARVLGQNGNDISIDFKIMNFSPVPTGIHHMNNKSILLGVGVIVFLMLVAYSVYIRKRRYHRMNLSEDRDIYASRMVPKGVKVDAYQEDQTEIKPPVGGPSPGIRNPHHRSRDSTDLQLPIWMVSDTG